MQRAIARPNYLRFNGLGGDSQSFVSSWRPLPPNGLRCLHVSVPLMDSFLVARYRAPNKCTT